MEFRVQPRGIMALYFDRRKYKSAWGTVRVEALPQYYSSNNFSLAKFEQNKKRVAFIYRTISFTYVLCLD